MMVRRAVRSTLSLGNPIYERKAGRYACDWNPRQRGVVNPMVTAKYSDPTPISEIDPVAVLELFGGKTGDPDAPGWGSPRT